MLDDTASKWKTLNSIERSQVATAAAGVRQREVFISLMENYDKALKYTETALNSAGSAADRYEHYLDNLEARMAQVNSTWEAIIYSDGTTEFFKNALSFLNDLLKGLPVVISLLTLAFGSINPVATAVAATLGVIIGNWDGIKAFFTGDDMYGLKNELADINDALGESVTELSKLESEIEDLNQRKLDGLITPEEELLLKWYTDEVRRLKQDVLELEKKAGARSAVTSYSGVSGVAVTEYNPTGYSADTFDANSLKTGQLDINSIQDAKKAYERLGNEIEQTKEIIDDLHSSYGADSPETKGLLDGATLSVERNEQAQKRLAMSLLATRKAINDSGIATSELGEYEKWVMEITDGLTESIRATAAEIDKLSNKEKLDALVGSLMNVEDVFASIKVAVNPVVAAFNEMNDAGEISTQTAINLIAANSDMIDMLEIENGVIRINKDLLRERFEITVQSYKTMREEAISLAETEIESSKQKIEGWKSEMETLDLLTQFGAIRALSITKQMQDTQRQVDSQLAQLAKLRQELKLLDGIGFSTFSSGSSSGKSTKQKQAEAYVKAITKQLDKEIAALQKEKDYWKNYYDAKIKGIKDQIAAMNEQEQVESKLLGIEEARAKLAKANQEVVRMYVEGQGFVYQRNMQGVVEAQSDLDKLLKEWDIYQKKLELDKQVKDFEDAKNKTISNIEEEIESLKDMSAQWKESLDISNDVNSYSGMLGNLKDFESASYSERMSMLQSFVASWNSQVASMRTPSPGGGASGLGSGSGTTAPKTPSNTTPISMAPKYKSIWETNNRRAFGTPSEKHPGIKLTGELGPELQVVNRGDGVITAGLTRNLMKWGEISPMNIFSKLSSNFTGSSGGNSVFNFAFDKLVLPNVSEYNGFVEALSARAGSISTQVAFRRR